MCTLFQQSYLWSATKNCRWRLRTTIRNIKFILLHVPYLFKIIESSPNFKHLLLINSESVEINSRNRKFIDFQQKRLFYNTYRIKTANFWRIFNLNRHSINISSSSLGADCKRYSQRSSFFIFTTVCALFKQNFTSLYRLRPASRNTVHINKVISVSNYKLINFIRSDWVCALCLFKQRKKQKKMSTVVEKRCLHLRASKNAFDNWTVK